MIDHVLQRVVIERADGIMMIVSCLFEYDKFTNLFAVPLKINCSKEGIYGAKYSRRLRHGHIVYKEELSFKGYPILDNSSPTGVH